VRQIRAKAVCAYEGVSREHLIFLEHLVMVLRRELKDAPPSLEIELSEIRDQLRSGAPREL
jgi:hypothetical protein